MNSIRNVQRAIEFEINRQIELLESQQTIVQETRAFDALKGITVSLRAKEAANDYRYFPEPDLPPLHITQTKIAEIEQSLPPLPRNLFLKYTRELHLSEYDAYHLTDQKSIALYYEELIKITPHFKAAANWMMGEVKSYLNEQGVDIQQFPIDPNRLAGLIALIAEGTVSHSIAAQRIFPIMLKDSREAMVIAKEQDLLQTTDHDAVQRFIDDVLASNSKEVERYRGGEKQLIGFFMGQFMKISGGKVDPKTANQLLRSALDA